MTGAEVIAAQEEAWEKLEAALLELNMVDGVAELALESADTVFEGDEREEIEKAKHRMFWVWKRCTRVIETPNEE